MKPVKHLTPDAEARIFGIKTEKIGETRKPTEHAPDKKAGKK